MDKDFEGLIERSCQDSAIKSNLAVAAIFGLAAFLLYAGIKISLLLFLFGLVAVGAGFYVINLMSGELKGGKFWLEMIKENPDRIVWIKPILVDHKVAYVFSMYKEKKFQFLTKSKMKITMVCNSEADQKVFMQGIKAYLPNAHLGYSPGVDLLYDEDAQGFVSNLTKKGLYRPVKTVVTEVF